MAEATQPAAEKNSKKTLLLVLLILLVAAASAGASWFFLNKPHEDKHEEAASEEHAEAAPPIFVDLTTFTVNLQPDGQFLQANFSLQVGTEKDAENLKLYMPQIRSRILLLLAGKTAEQLANQEGKNNLINEMKDLVQQPLAESHTAIKVSNVFVTSFIIQ